MDWLKLFTLLVAVVFTSVHADGPKKKIRIHLPQKVKHIHHHKKIYITNHPASSQYAPAYMSSGEGTVAVPSNILPAVANIVPFNSVNLFDETQSRLPNSPATSQLLPLYHARGYYGPTPNEIEEVDYDASEPVEYGPAVYSSGALHSSHPPKRLKIIKLNEPSHKKIIRKGKPKRVVVRKPQSHNPIEGELPVTTFHEQFYSDVDGSGTVRKVKKPPRIEKIVDGDTEHIHTYSEEHIHKLFYDQGAKVAGVVGVDPLTGMSAIATPQHIIPFKGSQTLVALPSHSFAGIAAVGAVGHPNNFEYAAYNPRDVTHDHIFHDHGEVPTDLELNKDSLALPPKVSYNSQGLRISGSQKKYKNKNLQKVKKPNKPVPTDFSYYEGIYTPNNRPRKIPRPTVPTFDTTGEAAVDDYRPIPNFGYKEIHKKPRSTIPSYYGKPNDFRSEQASVPTPFEISNTVLHEYKSKRYPGAGSSPESLTKFRDPFANFKDTYTNNFEYDTYASSSNTFRSEDKNDSGYDHHGKNSKKKSISTQNISFGGQDQITWNVDHTADGGNIDDDSVPTALDMDQFDQDQISNSVPPKDSTQVEQFFSLLAGRDFHGDQITMPDASNNNYQYAEAPTSPAAVHASATTIPNFKIESTEISPTESPNTTDSRKSRRNKETETKTNERHIRDNRSRSLQNQSSSRSHEADNTVGKLKYGDKI